MTEELTSKSMFTEEDFRLDLLSIAEYGRSQHARDMIRKWKSRINFDNGLGVSETKVMFLGMKGSGKSQGYFIAKEGLNKLKKFKP